MSTDQQEWNELEGRMSGWIDAWFRLYAGHEVDTGEMERLTQAVVERAEAMLSGGRYDGDGWNLLCRILMAHLTPVELETRRLAEEHQTFMDICLDGEPVTPYSRGQYLYREDDPNRRRELLSRVAQGHPALDQAWARHHAKQRELAAACQRTPLDDFLLGEGMTVAELRVLLFALGEGMRPAFVRRFAENRTVVLGDNQGEPWEDFFTLYLNRWTVAADRNLPPLDSVDAVCRTARAMGFPVDSITMDLVDRPRKMPGATAWDVRIPTDVRICVKPVGKAADLALVYHEMGHALHFSSIDPRLPFPIRTGFTHGVAETFSFWMESLLDDPLYLVEALGLPPKTAAEVAGFERLCKAAMATWLSAQALCIVDYWTDGPFTLEQLDARLRDYAGHFMGLSLPVGAIRLRPATLLALNLNTLGYPVAYVRLGHLWNHLEAKQRDWWRAPPAVEIVRAYMRGGRRAGFPSSMLDVGPFLERYGGV